jgi:hypothetical protein
MDNKKYKFSKIKISTEDCGEFENYYDTQGNILEEIASLSHINIFVGANNSGKSRFMRAL